MLWGRSLGKMGRFDEALTELQNVLAVVHRAEVYNALGEVKLASGDRRGAEQAFRAAVAGDPDSVDAHLALTQFLTATGRTADAERELQQLAAAHPTSESAQRAAAAFYLAAKRDGETERYLRAAAALPNQKLKSTLGLADFLIAARRFDEARARSRRSTRPMEVPAKVRLAAIALENGSAADARRMLDAALKKRTIAEGLALNAQLLQIEGKGDAALAAARAALEMNPEIAAAHYVAGSIELDRGNVDKAEQELRAALDDPRLVKAANLQLARAKLAGGDPADAIALAEAAGADLPARLTLARALVAAGQLPRARVELRQIAAAYPTSLEPPVLLGELELASGQLREARSQADRALAISPASVDALLLAARTSLAARDAAGAEQWLTRATSADPKSFDAFVMLAQLRASRRSCRRPHAIENIAARRPPDVCAFRTHTSMIGNKPGKQKSHSAGACT